MDSFQDNLESRPEWVDQSTFYSRNGLPETPQQGRSSVIGENLILPANFRTGSDRIVLSDREFLLKMLCVSEVDEVSVLIVAASCPSGAAAVHLVKTSHRGPGTRNKDTIFS